MAVVAVAVVGAAVVSAGTAIYLNSQRPDMPGAPSPANYISYDEDGNPSGSQTWDPATNSYVYRAAPLTEEQKLEKSQRAELRKSLLDNLSNTPEDRIKAYQGYAESFSSAMHTDVDKRFEKLKTSQEESLAAKGMLGSKAYADTVAEMNSDKLRMDAEIAQKAVLAKEELANTDRTYWLNTLNALDAKQSSDTVAGLQKQQNAMQGAIAGTSAITAQAQLNSSNMLTEWQSKMASNTELSKNLTNTSTGLAFLYGYKGAKPNPKSEYNIGT